jgi:hypothetical protein
MSTSDITKRRAFFTGRFSARRAIMSAAIKPEVAGFGAWCKSLGISYRRMVLQYFEAE